MKYSIDEETLTKIIKSGEMNDYYFAHLCAFFTDVPVPAIIKFAKQFNITIDELKSYYEKHIKDIYPNRDLEEVFIFE